jgi:hypothetical protein
MSVEKLRSSLRQVIDTLPFGVLDQAMVLLGEAQQIIDQVTQGTRDPAPFEVLRCHGLALDDIERACRALRAGQGLIESYLTKIGADGTGSAPLAPPLVAAATMRPSEAARSGGQAPQPPTVVAPLPVVPRVDHALVDEVERQGHKISRDKVVRIGRDRAQRVVWLETGNESRGARHILDEKKVASFVKFGVDRADIVDVVFAAATEGTPVGTSGRDRTVFEIEYRGKTTWIAVSVAGNGFIIGANPYSLTKKVKPLP